MQYVLIGDSGHAKVIEDILIASGKRIVAKLDDKYTHLIKVNEYIQGPLSIIETILEEDTKVIIAIGNNKVRQQIVNQLNLKPEHYGIAIHPSAIVSPSVKIGEGTVIMPNAVINADAVIGSHCIINTASVVEHDCEVASYVHIASGAVLAGCAKVQEGVHVGPNALVDVLEVVEKWKSLKITTNSTL